MEFDEVETDLPISSDMFFDVFPFHIVYTRGMVIRNIGSGLEAIMPHVIGQSVDEMFMLTRPMVEFSLENVSYLFFCLVYQLKVINLWLVEFLTIKFTKNLGLFSTN